MRRSRFTFRVAERRADKTRFFRSAINCLYSGADIMAVSILDVIKQSFLWHHVLQMHIFVLLPFPSGIAGTKSETRISHFAQWLLGTRSKSDVSRIVTTSLTRNKFEFKRFKNPALKTQDLIFKRLKYQTFAFIQYLDISKSLSLPDLLARLAKQIFILSISQGTVDRIDGNKSILNHKMSFQLSRLQ